MRKQFIVLETTQFDRPEFEPPPAPRPAVARGDGRVDLEVRLQPERAVAARGPRPPEHEHFVRRVEVITFYSIHEAEEYVENVLHDSPQLKFVVFESVAFLETIASPTVRKAWDQNGQLV